MTLRPLREFGLLLMLTMVGLWSYAPILMSGAFLSNDFWWIIYARDAPAQGSNFLRTGFTGTFRPTMAFSLRTDWRLWGLEPRGFLATNVLLHLCMVGTVYRLGRLGSPEGPRGPALLAAALFAAHPRHSEAVAWIAARGDLLYSLPYLWGLLAFLRSHERHSPVLRLIALGCFALALLGKESAVTCPLTVTLLILRVRVIPGLAVLTGGGLRPTLPFWGLLVVYVGYRRMVLGEWVGVYGASFHLNGDPGLIAENLARFLVALVWPANIPLAPYRIFLVEHPVLLLTLGLAVGGGVLLLRRTIPWREVGAGLIWVLVTTVPVWQISVSLADVRGERFLYLPSVGVCLGGGMLLYKMAVARRFRLGPVLCTAPILLLGGLTFLLSVRWVESGALAHCFVSDLSAQTSELPCAHDVYVLTVPRFLAPAYVLYGQGDIDGIQTLYGDPNCPRRIRGVTFQEMAFPEESLLAVYSDGSTVSVRVPLRASTWIDFGSVAHLGITPLPDAERRSDWIFQVPYSQPRDTLFAFTAGQLVRVW